MIIKKKFSFGGLLYKNNCQEENCNRVFTNKISSEANLPQCDQHSIAQEKNKLQPGSPQAKNVAKNHQNNLTKRVSESEFEVRPKIKFFLRIAVLFALRKATLQKHLSIILEVCRIARYITIFTLLIIQNCNE